MTVLLPYASAYKVEIFQHLTVVRYVLNEKVEQIGVYCTMKP